MARRFAARCKERLADESGLALIMAIGILMVLTVSATSVITYTASGARGAKLDESGQRAYALAEAGINNALSILAKQGSDGAGVGAQPGSANDPASTVTTYANGGTATWGASWNATDHTWTIKSIGASPNPTGPAASQITRTLYASVTVPVPPYSFVQLDDTCDKHELVIRSSGTLDVRNAIYTNSCNASHDAFDIFGTGGTIKSPDIRVVGGWETHDGNDVIVNGVTCPLLNANPPLADVAGCPKMGQPVLTDPFKTLTGPNLGSSPACPNPVYGSVTSYPSSPNPPGRPFTATAVTISATTLTATNSVISDGTVIQIDSEKMLVQTASGSSLQVQRGYLGTTIATHNTNKEIKYIPVTGSSGTAANPAQCKVPAGSGSVTLAPGTYYGGLCIGSPDASTDCTSSSCTPSAAYSFGNYSPTSQKLNAAINDSQTTLTVNGILIANNDVIQVDAKETMLVTGIVSVVGSVTTITVTRGYAGTTALAAVSGKTITKGTLTPTANVTLQAGTYIMAGGGFWVCGNSALTAPNVLLYNTNDPTFPTGNGAVATILLNTTGVVQLGPQDSGKYAGLTIFQDRTQSVAPTSQCDSRGSNTTLDDEDISFQSMASTGPKLFGGSGALGSVAGTIYAPATKALFLDGVSGTGNIALMTACIFIDGANSVFKFDMGALFGMGIVVNNQYG